MVMGLDPGQRVTRSLMTHMDQLRAVHTHLGDQMEPETRVDGACSTHGVRLLSHHPDQAGVYLLTLTRLHLLGPLTLLAEG